MLAFPLESRRQSFGQPDGFWLHFDRESHGLLTPNVQSCQTQRVWNLSLPTLASCVAILSFSVLFVM